jgi:pimeloyl-ACP methyl ester carboxylesterase
MDKPTIVLVHGAWQGSWSFDAWRPLLEARGYRTVAVDLPGNGWNPAPLGADGLADYTAHVVGVIERLDRPCVLLGHSGGGMTVSQVAETAPERVAALVYLAGFMLPSAMPFINLVAEARAAWPERDFAGIVRHLVHLDQGAATQVPIAAALDIFLHDCPPEAALAAAANLRVQPEAGRAVAARITPARQGRIPRIYIEALNDRSIDIRLQRMMQRLSPGATRISLACGHVPQLAMPEELTDKLCAALDRLNI